MTFDNDPEHDLRAHFFKMEIENDEDDRRRFTTFGYNHGKMPGLFMWLILPFAIAAFTIIGIAMFYVPNHPDFSMATSSLIWWAIVPPFTLLPVTAFVFLKPHYALRALGVIIAICLELALAVVLFYLAIGAML